MRTLMGAIVCSPAGPAGPVGPFTGPAGPAGERGPTGPAGDSPSMDDATIASIAEQLQELSDTDLSTARRQDSERLDNLETISKAGRFAERPPIFRLARGFPLSRERRVGPAGSFEIVS